MCGKHARLIDKTLRIHERKLRKMLKKVETVFDANPTRKNAGLCLILCRWCEQAWHRGKVQAIERAAGIA